MIFVKRPVLYPTKIGNEIRVRRMALMVKRCMRLILLLLIPVIVMSPVHAAETAPAGKKPLVSPPDDAYPPRFEEMENVSTFFCHTRFDKGMQSNLTLEIDFGKHTVNETPAMISPLDIQWIRTDARGRSFMYRLNRHSGFLQGGAIREQNQMTGWCERIQNR